MTRPPISSDFKLGILGGGQLGKMLIQPASKWDIACHVLDPDPLCPAASTATTYVQGDFRKYEDVLQFGRTVDMLTIEIENVNTEALHLLQSEGKKIHPSPDVIDVIKDKGRQKAFYTTHNIPTSPFLLFRSSGEIRQACGKGHVKRPFVWKSCTEGYDGRGVEVIRQISDLDKLPDVPAVVENLVEIKKEIAVLISRSEEGETRAFEPVEMEFNAGANLVEMLLAPARISETQSREAIAVAGKVSAALGHVGILAVELFLTESGDWLVNEVAPRPHNSGHHTIEATASSQYEQHLRTILGLPAGSTRTIQPAVMINLLGSEEHSGPVVYRNINEALALPQAYIHIYGKKQTKPFRKMGHITLCGKEMDHLIREGKRLKNLIRVVT